MAQLSISEVARQVGLRPSAIRYYEQIGILPPAQRSSGQRRYDNTILYRLAVVQRAQQMGFTLEEIQQLFFGFGKTTSASVRWKKLSQRKLVELQALTGQIKEMQGLLKKLMHNCHCDALDQCGKAMLQCARGEVIVKPFPARRYRRDKQ